MGIRYAGRFLEFVDQDGWEFVRRRRASGVACVVALTPDDRLLLVEQRRLPVDAAVIELPAGLAGDEVDDEDLLLAAARELEEETGWRPARCRVLGRGPSSAGLTSEIVTLVRADGLQRIGPGGGVPGETIVVHVVPLADAARWLAERAATGALIDPKVYAGLWWLTQEPPTR